MSFFGQACVGHSQASTDPAAACCPGYTKWGYDANTGIAYNGFMCWTAPCAAEGQFAGPGGQGNNCCAPLVNANGKCTVAVPPTGGNGVPTMPPIIETCVGTILCSVEDWMIYAGLAGVVLLMAMGGKK